MRKLRFKNRRNESIFSNKIWVENFVGQILLNTANDVLAKNHWNENCLVEIIRYDNEK